MANRTYNQRVYDTTAGWCYYQKTEIDETPLSTETTPNHTNNLTIHEVIADSDRNTPRLTVVWDPVGGTTDEENNVYATFALAYAAIKSSPSGGTIEVTGNGTISAVGTYDIKDVWIIGNPSAFVPPFGLLTITCDDGVLLENPTRIENVVVTPAGGSVTPPIPYTSLQGTILNNAVMLGNATAEVIDVQAGVTVFIQLYAGARLVGSDECVRLTATSTLFVVTDGGETEDNFASGPVGATINIINRLPSLNQGKTNVAFSGTVNRILTFSAKTLNDLPVDTFLHDGTGGTFDSIFASLPFVLDAGGNPTTRQYGTIIWETGNNIPDNPGPGGPGYDLRQIWIKGDPDLQESINLSGPGPNFFSNPFRLSDVELHPEQDTAVGQLVIDQDGWEMELRNVSVDPFGSSSVRDCIVIDGVTASVYLTGETTLNGGNALKASIFVDTFGSLNLYMKDNASLSQDAIRGPGDVTIFLLDSGIVLEDGYTQTNLSGTLQVWSRNRRSSDVVDTQTGTTPKVIGAIELPQGRILANESVVNLQNSAGLDTSTLQIVAPGGGVVGTFTHTGTTLTSVGPTGGNDIVIAAQGIYTLRLLSSAAPSTASIFGYSFSY